MQPAWRDHQRRAERDRESKLHRESPALHWRPRKTRPAKEARYCGAGNRPAPSGWSVRRSGSHPLESAAFSRRTPKAALSRGSSPAGCPARPSPATGPIDTIRVEPSSTRETRLQGAHGESALYFRTALRCNLMQCHRTLAGAGASRRAASPPRQLDIQASVARRSRLCASALSPLQPPPPRPQAWTQAEGRGGGRGRKVRCTVTVTP